MHSIWRLISKMTKQEGSTMQSESLLATQKEVNPFLEYELEELLNIPVVIGSDGQEPELLTPKLSEIEQIKNLPSTASGDSAESVQQLPAPNSEEVGNQHLGQSFSFEQVYQGLAFPNVISVSRDVANYSNAQPNINDAEIVFISNNIITTSTNNNIDATIPCDSIVTTFFDTLNSQNNAFSLRDAIIEANQQEATTEIHLCSGQYVLEQAGRHENNSERGDLDILSHLILKGDDKNTTIINGNNLDRIFQVFPNAILELHNLTLMGGDAHSFNGGAILNAGHVILNNVSIVGNSARIGGGVFNTIGSELDVHYSVLAQNQAELYGGGILNNGANIHMDSSIVQQNISGAYGAGITNLFGNITINKSLIVENSTGVLGAGLANFAGDVVVDTTTISGNMAGWVGGGIANFYGQSLQIYNSTITDNAAGIVGAGVYNIQPTILQSPTIQSSIIAQNNSDQDLFGTQYQSLGHNLIGNADGAAITPIVGDLIGSSANIISAGLALLADNGGATQTHGLLANSLAIDHGNPLDLRSDQRDFSLNLERDIGAFEYNGLIQNNTSLIQVVDVLSDLNLTIELALASSGSSFIPSPASNTIEPDEFNADLYQFFGSFPSINEQLHAIETDDFLDIII